MAGHGSKKKILDVGKAQIRRAGIADQMAVLEWLQSKFAKK